MPPSGVDVVVGMVGVKLSMQEVSGESADAAAEKERQLVHRDVDCFVPSERFRTSLRF